jgi:hypothetical protein
LLPAVVIPGATVVETEAVLFEPFRSLVEAVTLAFVWTVPEPVGAVMVTTTGGASPTARLGRVQTTVEEPEQLQPLPEALTSVAPEGTVAERETEVAEVGPAL